MGAGASSQQQPTVAADLLSAVDELSTQAKEVPVGEQTSAQLNSLAERLGQLQAAAAAMATAKAATETKSTAEAAEAATEAATETKAPDPEPAAAEPEKPEKPAEPTAADPALPSVADWGLSVFKQFDTDKDGKLSNKELSRALKSLPKTKPSTVSEGAKFQSVEEMVAAMDTDGDGSVDEKEWLDNLSKCAGLASALSENVDPEGKVANFRTFEQQAAKCKTQLAALKGKENKSEEETAKLAELEKEVASWDAFFVGEFLG